MRAWTLLFFSVFFSVFSHTSFAARYAMPPPGDDVVGENYIITVERGDSLATIRKTHDISYHELLQANPHINFYKLKIGQEIVISREFILPKYRRGIVINIPELRLYYFTPDGQYVYTFPVGLGRVDWRTPTTFATIVDKQIDPIWHVPEDIRAYVLEHTGELLDEEIPPGPKNPLGSYALYLSENGYLIHGTNAPDSVGTFISSGCMRLLHEPIEFLYQTVPIGTPVYVIHCPNKSGWSGNTLYLEAHPFVDGYQASTLGDSRAEAAIYDAIGDNSAYINWDLVSRIAKAQTGIPEPIGKKSRTYG